MESPRGVSRRRFLGTLGLTAGAVAVAGAGGATWWAVERGVFSAGTGPAYAAWDGWNPSGGDVLDLVRAAVLAASAHNTQPWLFQIASSRIDLFADPARNIGTFDPLGRELQISLGCALENVVLAASRRGKAATVSLLPSPADQTHVARIEFAPAQVSTSPLVDALPHRHTNRLAYDTARPLSQATLDALEGLIDIPDIDVVWFTSTGDKRAFGDLTVRATRAIIADPQQSADSFAWWRHTWSEIQARKDGLTVDAFVGGPPITRILAKMLPASREGNDDGWLAATRDTHVPTAAAFGTLTAREPLDPVQRLHLGRVWQRMHLWATANGLAAQPLNQVEERMDRERTKALPPEFTNAMVSMLSTGWYPLFSFRIGHPTATALRSPRRPAEEVLR